MRKLFKRVLGIFIVCCVLIVDNNYIFASNKNKSGFSDEILNEIRRGNVIGHNLFYLSPVIEISAEKEALIDLSRIDWNSDDWDGDGIKNKDEISVKKSDLGYCYIINSNPLYDNSDFDIYLDGQEKNGKASPIRYSFSKSDFDNLFMSNITDDIITNIILSANLAYADLTFGEDEEIIFDNALKEFLNSSIEDKSVWENIANCLDAYTGDYIDNMELYGDTMDNLLGAAPLGYINIGVEAIKQVYSDVIIRDYKDRLKQYDSVLANLEKDKLFKMGNLFGRGKDAVQNIRNIINSKYSISVVESAVSKSLIKVMSNVTISELADLVPYLGEAKIMIDTGLTAIKKTTTIDEDYERALKCITYASLVRAIGTEIKKSCDKNKVKVGQKPNITEEVYTIKKGKVKYVNELFKDYIRALSMLIDNYNANSKIVLLLCSNYKKADKESIIKSLKDIDKRISISLYYDMDFKNDLSAENIRTKIKNIDINKIPSDEVKVSYDVINELQDQANVKIVLDTELVKIYNEIKSNPSHTYGTHSYLNLPNSTYSDAKFDSSGRLWLNGGAGGARDGWACIDILTTRSSYDSYYNEWGIYARTLKNNQNISESIYDDIQAQFDNMKDMYE